MGLRLRAVAVIAALALLAATLPLSAGAVSSTASTLSTCAAGSATWASTYNLGTPGTYGKAMAVSPNGSTVFVTGSTVNLNSSNSLVTLAYGACTGKLLWTATYGTGGDDIQISMVVSPDGSKVFVTGGQLQVGDTQVTIALDGSSGAQLWMKTYSCCGDGTGGYSLAVSPDGSKVFVTGPSGASLAGSDRSTIAYDASNGAQLWEVTDGFGRVGAVSPDGSTIFVAGTTSFGPICEFSTAALDASNGNQRWAANYVGISGGCSAASALVVSPDGSKVFVTGSAGPATNACASPATCPIDATVAYAASTGTLLWSALYSGGDGNDQPSGIAVSPDSSEVTISGRFCQPYTCARWTYGTVAYDASTGSRLWVAVYDDGCVDEETGLAMGPDGSTVFVTGWSFCISSAGSKVLDGATVAYDAATGAERSVTHGPGNYNFALGVNPDGSTVYTTGYSVPGATGASAASGALPTSAGRAAKCSGECGVLTSGFGATPGGPGIYEDTNPLVTYDGWNNVFDATALGGAYRASGVRNQSATFKTPKTSAVVWYVHRGPDQGMAKVTIDGRSKGTFDLYSAKPSSGSLSFTGLSLSAHKVKVAVLGVKNPSSTDTLVGINGFGSLSKGRIISSLTGAASVAIGYDAWTGFTNAKASGGTYRLSRSPASSVTLVFTGTGVDWITAMGPSYGRARVAIDGVARPAVDLYRRNQHWRYRVSFSGLKKGRHTIIVSPSGMKDPASTSSNVVIDAFVVH